MWSSEGGETRTMLRSLARIRGGLIQRPSHQLRFGGSLVKNKNYEEWNGMREVSEKSFELKANSTVPQIFGYLVVPFIALYVYHKEEMVRH